MKDLVREEHRKSLEDTLLQIIWVFHRQLDPIEFLGASYMIGGLFARPRSTFNRM